MNFDVDDEFQIRCRISFLRYTYSMWKADFSGLLNAARKSSDFAASSIQLEGTSLHVELDKILITFPHSGHDKGLQGYRSYWRRSSGTRNRLCGEHKFRTYSHRQWREVSLTSYSPDSSNRTLSFQPTASSRNCLKARRSLEFFQNLSPKRLCLFRYLSEMILKRLSLPMMFSLSIC